MPNEETEDGRIYDPVAVDDYPSRPYEEARQAPKDEVYHQVTYEDPEHHHTGNMTVVSVDKPAPENEDELREQLMTEADGLGVKLTMNMKTETMQQKVAEAREAALGSDTGT